MDHQFHRGIYRPNAQRLSISLAPLVAQRSLLFRVKADLATKTSYGQLTPTEESPGLFLLSASTASAKIISAALSVMSAASVYSQESWKGDKSPFGPLLVPQHNVDTRRHAIAFSPSVQWEDLSEDSDRDSDSTVKTPLQSASSLDLSIVLPQEDARNSTELVSIPSLEPEFPAPEKPVDVQLPLKLEAPEGGPAGKLTKKKRAEDTNTKHVSKHSKAFGKVMSHLSLQPSKKESAKAAARRQTTITLVSEYQLPELKAGLSPIRMSFIARSPPVLPALAVPRPAPPSFHYVKASEARKILQDVPSQRDEKARQLRMTMPATPLQRSTTPPSATPALMPAKKGHRRYKSSPAVAQFDFKAWNTEDMPPLPVMPPLPARPRAGSITTQAISAPFPVRASLPR